MLLFKQNFSSQLREAFSQSMLEREGNSLKIIAEDAEVEVNYTSLAILSPFFRGLMTSLPTCCSPLHLSLPGTTASSVQLFFSLLADGTTKKNVFSSGEAAEVVNVARIFDLDASNYSLVGSGGQAEIETVSDQIVIVPNRASESKPEYRESKPEYVDIKPDYMESKPDLLQESMAPILNSFGLGAEISLDETIPNVSTFEEVAGAGAGAGPGQEEELNCQVCSLDHTNLSSLLIHYVQTHYTREMYEEMENVVVGKQCKLCGRDCKSRQQLAIHIGVKHRRINIILARHGYKEYNTGRAARAGRVAGPARVKVEPSVGSSPGLARRQQHVCQLCQKTFDSSGLLWQHYASNHFQAELKQNYAQLMDLESLRCLQCHKQMKQRAGLIVHVGTVHMKVNDILSSYGYKTLEVRESKLEKSQNTSSASEIIDILN